MIQALSLYQHIENKDFYYVLLTTNKTATQESYQNRVSYINTETKNAYCRLESEFKDKFMFVRRMNTEELADLAELIKNSH